MNQSYLKKFIRYASLSVLGTLGVSCYILADTFFIAKGLGTNGLAALNIAIPVYNFIHGTGLMLAMGGATKFSICKGIKDNKKMNQIFTNTVYLALLFSFFFMMIGIFFSRSLALLLGANSNILEMTNTYLTCLLLFAPAFIMNDVLLCFIRNDNNPTLATTAMLIGSFSNIILDYIFIFPFQMGIFGAVFATGLSPIISMMIMSWHWLKKKNEFGIQRTRFSWHLASQNFSLGFPSLIDQIAAGIAMIVFNMLILNLEGNIGVAAYGVIANISLVVIALYTGICQGIQPLISEAYGKEDQHGIQSSLRYAMITMVILSLIIYLIIFIFAHEITQVFNSENNVHLALIAVEGLKLYFLAAGFVGFNTILATFFTSTERAFPAHVLSLLRGLILIIPIAFLLSSLWKMTGIWLTYPVCEGIVALLGSVIFIKMKKKN